MATPEGRIKAVVTAFLKGLQRRTRLFFFMPANNGYGRSGLPDYVLCVPAVVTQEMVGQKIGLFVGIETKRPGGEDTVRPIQLLVASEIKDAGGKWFLVCSEHDARRVIESLNL